MVMRSGAAPLWEQLVILILGPPIMTALWWIAARGWALAVQGGTTSRKTKKRQRVEFFVVLILMYAVGFGVVLYAWLR
jgi:hypothetical protein